VWLWHFTEGRLRQLLHKNGSSPTAQPNAVQHLQYGTWHCFSQNTREQICALLGYYAANSVKSLPTFRDNPLVPPSSVRKSKGFFLDFLTTEYGTDRFSGVPTGVSTPPPPKFRRPSKIVPNSTRLWKLLKIAEFRTPTHQDVRKEGSKILKLPSVRNCFTLAIQINWLSS